MKKYSVFSESYLNKNQYDYRDRSAQKRMEQNALIETLTEEQHEALAGICYIRHKMHSNIDRIIKGDDEILKEVTEKNLALEEADLKPIPGIPTDKYDIEITSLDFEIEYDEDMPERYDENEKETKEWLNWYEDTYERLYNEVEKWNKNIEKYLTEIDKKHKTNYAPSGALRI